MKISVAKGGDRSELVELLAVQLREHRVEIDDETLGVAIDGLIVDPRRGAILVARDDDGAAIGVACLSWTWTIEHGGRAAWLDELYVAPERRGAGVGTALLHAAVDLAKRNGCRAIDLEVEEDHVRVESLYRRKGFSPRTRRRWFTKLT